MSLTGVAGFAEGGGVDEVDVAPNESGKGGLGIPGDVLREQIPVGDIVHLLINVRCQRKRPTYFWIGREFRGHRPSPPLWLFSF